MSVKNSKKASRKLPLFSCPNPDCPVRYRSFDTIKGYQNHLTHYPVCTAYAYTRHPFLTAIDGKHTQPIAMATVPTVAYAQEILNDSWNSSTLYTGNARVTQHARLPQPWIPTWVHTKLSRLCNLWWHWRSCNQQQWTHPWGSYHAIRSWCCWGYRGLESSSADPIPQWHAATGRYCLPGTLWITTMISPWRWWSDPPLGHPVCHLPPSNKPLALVVPSSHHKSQTLMFLS